MSKYKYADERKRIILDAFASLLKTTPYDKISIRMIEKESGISHRMFYYYFKDKQDIISSFLELSWNPFLQNIDRALDSVSEDSLSSMTTPEIMSFIITNAVKPGLEANRGYLHSLFICVNDDVLMKKYKELNENYYSEFSDRLIRAGIKENYAKDTAYLLTALFDGIMLDSFFEKEERLLKVIDDLPKLLK